MAAYREGEAAAFQELVKRHERPLYRFCMRSLGNPDAAADATQEVFLRVVKNAARWEERAKFTTWMYTIARNFCIDEVRKRNFRKTDSLNEMVGRDDDGGTEKIDQVTEQGPSSDRLTDSVRIRHVVDAALAERAPDARPALANALARLDRWQDDEPERSPGVESVFHPIPSLAGRLRALERPHATRAELASDPPLSAPALSTWHLARTALVLSHAGLSLLPRAVHCNAGRPELWIWLPADG